MLFKKLYTCPGLYVIFWHLVEQNWIIFRKFKVCIHGLQSLKNMRGLCDMKWWINTFHFFLFFKVSSWSLGRLQRSMWQRNEKKKSDMLSKIFKRHNWGKDTTITDLILLCTVKFNVDSRYEFSISVDRFCDFLIIALQQV